jgi:hypothetical protein
MTPYFEVADNPDMTYDEKLVEYKRLADEHFETERYWDFVETHLPHLEDDVNEWVASDEFDRLLKDTVATTYPPHEQDQFMAHFRGLIGLRNTTA